MHQDEIWQVFWKNGEPVVGEGWEARLGNPEVTGSEKIVGVAIVLVYRRNADGEVELLWQRRSEKVDRFAGDYDLSAGGHINLGETVVEAAKREAFEEIGAEILADELSLVTIRSFNRNRIAWIFAADYTGRAEDFRFSDEEVSEVKWVPLAEVDEFREKFAKAPLKKDALTLELFREWVNQ